MVGIIVDILYRFIYIKQLIHHQQLTHKVKMDYRELSFQSQEEFLQWKEMEEKLTHSSYIKHCAPKIIGDIMEHCYYYCNRTGKYEGRGEGKRQIKSQGSSKLGCHCTAFIKTIRNTQTKDSEIKVEYCATHNTHNVELAHLRISSETRAKIAAKLQQGVTVEKILDEIRDTLVDGGIHREHIVTRQDINNVRLQYNIEGIQRHPNDLTSVCAWVEEMHTLPYDPVVLFKCQGEQQPQHTDNLGKDDFLLVLQTEFQRDMLQKHGNNTVCVDTTYGTNVYDFYLITIMVIDDFGEGVPVGWGLSNREDTTLLTEMLKAIESKTGSIIPLWFMSDDANQFFSAWIGVFGRNKTKKLLCVWHLDRAWRQALGKHVANKETQIEIYHHLQLLMQETGISEFRITLQKFLTILEVKSHDFLDYFKKTYLSRVEEWATCYRVGAPLNTNMFVESFHRVLKIVYLQQKQNRRLDFLLSTLLKIARDKAFEILTKHTKGKNTHRVCELNKRHKLALQISSTTSINMVDDTTWKVSSSANSSVLYTVQRTLGACNCYLHCQSCKTCVHMYSCTCLDASLHTTVCKHCHLVHMKYAPSQQQDSHQPSLAYYEHVLNPSRNTCIAKPSITKQSIQDKIYELQTRLKTCTDANALTAVHTHIGNALHCLKAIQAQPKVKVLPVKRQFPANKKSETQCHFFSTKSKRAKIESSLLSKPTPSATKK